MVTTEGPQIHRGLHHLPRTVAYNRYEEQRCPYLKPGQTLRQPREEQTGGEPEPTFEVLQIRPDPHVEWALVAVLGAIAAILIGFMFLVAATAYLTETPKPMGATYSDGDSEGSRLAEVTGVKPGRELITNASSGVIKISNIGIVSIVAGPGIPISNTGTLPPAPNPVGAPGLTGTPGPTGNPGV